MPEQELIALFKGVLREELAPMKEEISLIKKDLAPMKDEISSMKKEISSVKEEVSSMKDEISSIKKELIPMRENIKKIDDRISVLEVKSQITHKKLDSLTLDVKIAERDTRKDIMQSNDAIETLVAVLEAKGILPRVL